jgi:uncharacterized protein (DUF2267 family)
MEHAEFVETVAQAAEISYERAESVTRTVLETLGDRIDRGQARDLAAQLPPEEAAWVATDSPSEGFDADAFVKRVAEREGVDEDEAEQLVRAVFVALQRAVARQELEDVVAQLSRDYRRFVFGGPGLAGPAFRARVAKRTGLDEDAAGRAIAAVLETLAERIAGGEVDDLTERLPSSLHEPLRRGKESSGGKATRMPFEEFLRRVAEREGVGSDDARDHARIVLATLREAVGDDEFFDVTVQLPPEYAPVLA